VAVRLEIACGPCLTALVKSVRRRNDPFIDAEYRLTCRACTGQRYEHRGEAEPLASTHASGIWLITSHVVLNPWSRSQPAQHNGRKNISARRHFPSSSRRPDTTRMRIWCLGAAALAFRSRSPASLPLLPTIEDVGCRDLRGLEKKDTSQHGRWRGNLPSRARELGSPSAGSEIHVAIRETPGDQRIS